MKYRFKDPAKQAAAQVIFTRNGNSLAEELSYKCGKQFDDHSAFVGCYIEVSKRDIEPVPEETRLSLQDKVAALRKEHSMHDIMVALSATIND